MRSVRCTAVIAAIAAVLSVPAAASAQATRTWVSGVGDDANPCSRTAPCKTFAGAISKTAAAGEIDTLDPGGFGAVTLTKSITIDGTTGLAGVLVSGTNGIVVNAGASDVVILRNLDINGLGSGLSGILILAAGDVRVEDCKIYRFSGRGIDDRRSSGRLAVANTVVSDNAQTGILTLTSSGSTLAVNLDHVQMHNNGNAGFATTGGTHAVVSHSSATSNVYGFYADSGASLHLDDVVSFANSNTGIIAFSGAAIRIFNSTITNNTVGVAAASGASVGSFGLNRIFANASGNAPNGSLPLQ